jgi:putative GTP pyrophosphokinase
VAGDGYSKREVSRAGQHLAERLTAMREGRRPVLIDPEDPADNRAREIVEWWRSQHVEPMLAVRDAVIRLAPQLDLRGIRISAVSFRPKRFDSTIEKLIREPGKLADMVDIGGVRAVVATQEDADDLHGWLKPDLEIRRVRDWARSPRATGYRALHLHVRQGGYMIEVQIRTVGQDMWANIVEEESRLSGMNYKAGEGNQAVLEFFRLLADLLASVEIGETHAGFPERYVPAYRAAKPHLQSPRLRELDL